MPLNKKRAWLVLLSLVVTFVGLRVWLHIYPNTDLNIGSYNIHHLYTGILFVVFCGIPLVLLSIDNRLMDLLSIGFGAGLGMVLDEWVYLIATDGSNASYLLPVSLYGGIIFIALVAIYIIAFILFSR